ncbi:MAG: hypothetical protein EXR66_06190 [Dehalococcoidia bacterium]|nr:hypothetical protein [Dehalococcoidia bacterium]
MLKFAGYDGLLISDDTVEVRDAADYWGTLAIECFEQGVLTKEDTDGLELTWGQPVRGPQARPRHRSTRGLR